MSGMELLRILRSVKVIAKRWVNEVAGDESTLLVGLISLILSMGVSGRDKERIYHKFISVNAVVDAEECH